MGGTGSGAPLEGRDLPDGRHVVKLEDLWGEWWSEYVSGMSQKDIARTYGVSQFSVQEGLHTYLEKHYNNRTITMARDLDMARIEAMIDRLWRSALDSGKIPSMKLVAKLIELRARILGYAAPRRVEHTGQVDVDVTVQPEVAELLKQIHDSNARVRGSLERKPDDVVDAEIVDDVSG
jgi:hypothetical protein